MAEKYIVTFEELIETETFGNYTYKFIKDFKFSKQDASHELMTNLFLVMEKFEGKDEKYYFQKAYQNAYDQYLSGMGKDRYWDSNEKKKVRLENVAYEEQKDKREYVEISEYSDAFDEYDLDEAFEILDSKFTKNQAEFAKEILKDGYEFTMYESETRKFNQKFKRLIEQCEKRIA
ncbi:hypothetical protein [Enterococcus sp. AZ102]|uniref:hypothetical protein n=1 Tax=Enterococcus sp. AZ102 TaxID=2774865 RepID=UPI003F24C80C